MIDKHSFHCECEKGFTGRLCHQQVEFELPDFLNIESENIDGGSGFVKYVNGDYGVIQ